MRSVPWRRSVPISPSVAVRARETPAVRVAIPLEQCWHEVPGGTARASLDLVDALVARADIEVVGVSAQHASLPPPPWRPTVPVSALPLPRLALYEAWHGLRRPRVERATGPVDVLHVAGGAVAASAAPLVVTVHDLAFRHHPGLFSRHGIRFFERALELTRREAVRVLCPSQATLEDCVSAGIDRDRLRHVPWGCDVEEVSDETVERAKASVGVEGDYVVVVGTLEPRKNLRGLFAAWELLDRDDLQLVVIGPTGWGDATGGEPPANVSVVGFVDRWVRDGLYAGARVSCYPSLFEGFGLPVLESMALGCPVVTSAGTATEELVSGGAGVAVEPTDPAAIAAGLASVLDDPARRAALVAAGRGRAATHTWERTAALTVEAYREALSLEEARS